MITGARIQSDSPSFAVHLAHCPRCYSLPRPPEVLTADAIKRCNQHARTAACELVGGGVAQGVKVAFENKPRSGSQNRGEVKALRQMRWALFVWAAPSYRPVSGIKPALVITGAASGDARKRISALAASGCRTVLVSAPGEETRRLDLGRNRADEGNPRHVYQLADLLEADLRLAARDDCGHRLAGRAVRAPFDSCPRPGLRRRASGTSVVDR